MEIALNNNIDREKWKEFLNQNSFASPFQTPEFYDFFKSISNQDAEVIAVYDTDHNIKALTVVVIQKENSLTSFFSKRGIIYGGPLLLDEKSAKILFDFVKQYIKKKVIYLEIRNFFDYNQYDKIYRDYNFEYKPYLNVILKTTSTIEELTTQMNKTRARQIRQTVKKGAYVQITRDIKEINELYTILSELYKHKVKLPLPKLEFFLKLSKSQICKVFVTKLNNEVVGGVFTLFQKNNGIYTYYYCGKEGLYKNVYATHLALHEVIKFAVDNDLSHVDFMGAGLKGEAYGVRTYKERFGGKTVEHGRYLLVTKPILFKIGKLGLSILQKFK